jgi:hypothetical protein
VQAFAKALVDRKCYYGYKKAHAETKIKAYVKSENTEKSYCKHVEYTKGKKTKAKTKGKARTHIVRSSSMHCCSILLSRQNETCTLAMGEVVPAGYFLLLQVQFAVQRDPYA